MTAARVVFVLVVIAGCSSRREEARVPVAPVLVDERDAPRPSQAELVQVCVKARDSLHACRVDADTLLGPQLPHDAERTHVLTALLASEDVPVERAEAACADMAREVPDALPESLVTSFEDVGTCFHVACGKQPACFRPLAAILVAPR